VTTELRLPPELDVEDDVDLGRYAGRVGARWWLALVGLVAGAVLGWLAFLGSEEVYRAQALVYLGQPMVPGGAARVDTLATSSATVREIVHSEAAIRRAARESGLGPARLRDSISVQGGTGPPRSVQAALVTIAVQGGAPARVQTAANTLAGDVVRNISDYADQKIEALETQIEAAEEELALLNRRIEAALALAEDETVGAGDQVVAISSATLWESRRTAVQQSRIERQQLLLLARTVEQPRVVQPAIAHPVTAQSRRNAMIVGAVLGLLAGLAAALAWEPVAARVRRSTR
jgi:uncharacterized protein involved in exopolysaccharide biosynthesis